MALALVGPGATPDTRRNASRRRGIPRRAGDRDLPSPHPANPSPSGCDLKLRSPLGLAAAATAMVVTFAAPQASAAACQSAGSPSARALAMDDPQVSGRLLANTGVWLSLIKEKGLAAEIGRATRDCERSAFQTSRGRYVLRGETGDYVVLRLAVPSARSAPVAYLIPILDLTATLTAGPAKPTPVAAYALTTSEKDTQTVWRFYDAVPEDAVLGADMAAAVSGGLRPLLTVEGTQIRIILPAS
jgi:hypothetical protein